MEKLNIKTGDLTIRIFHFNFIQVNTYVLHDDTGEAVIIDPGNYVESEDNILAEYIEKENLKVKYIITTHPHIDHILGNEFCKKQYRADLLMHEAGLPIYRNAPSYGSSFGIDGLQFPEPDRFLKAGDLLSFGNQQLEVRYTPGHCDGSICLYDKKHNLVFTGDVLFEESIGRTDLPTGNLELLLASIKANLLTLDDSVMAYPGHGDNTLIGRERTNNPYLQNI